MRRLLIAISMLPAIALAAPPQVNLRVELRWVESVVSGAAIAGVEEGAVVVGTAGSVGLKSGGTFVSTQSDSPVQSAPPMLVLNGKTAHVTMSDTQTVQWVDANVSPGSGSPSSRAQGRLRSQPVERQRGFSVTPLWAGGKQPVQIEVHALDVGAHGEQADMLTTVEVPLGQWLTIARRGPPNPTPDAPGEVRSSDAEGVVSHELQVRVSLVP